MDIKKTCYLFFDFDGTITTDVIISLPDGTRTHRRILPQEHLNAIRAVHDAGHKIFLCTGRSRGSMYVLGKEWQAALDLPWDGMIFGASDMWHDGKRISVKYIPHEECFFWLYYCKNTRRVFCYNGTEVPLRYDFSEELSEGQAGEIYSDVEKQLKINPLTNFSTVPSATDFDMSRTSLTVIHLPTYTDIFPADCNKGSAISEFCKLIGAPIGQTVCFGDSANDVEMFKACDLSVAMRNAPEELREVSSYIAEGEFGVAEAILNIFNIS